MTQSIGARNLMLWFEKRKITFFQTADGICHFNPTDLTGSFEQIFLDGDHQHLVRVRGLSLGTKIIFDDYDSVYHIHNPSDGWPITFHTIDGWDRFFDDYVVQNCRHLTTYDATERRMQGIKNYRVVDPHKVYPITEVTVSSKNGLTARLFAVEAMTGSHADQIDSVQLEEILKSLIAFPLYEGESE